MKKKYIPFTVYSLDELNHDNLELSKQILKCIKYACDNKLIMIVVAHLVEKDTIRDIRMHNNDYAITLNKIIKTFEFYEEYELCADIVKLLKKINNIDFIYADSNLSELINESI